MSVNHITSMDQHTEHIGYDMPSIFDMLHTSAPADSVYLILSGLAGTFLVTCLRQLNSQQEKQTEAIYFVRPLSRHRAAQSSLTLVLQRPR